VKRQALAGFCRISGFERAVATNAAAEGGPKGIDLKSINHLQNLLGREIAVNKKPGT